MPLKELVPEKLWEYENFLTEDEVSLLVSTVTNAPEEDWFKAEMDPNDINDAGKNLCLDEDKDVGPVISEIAERVNSLFSDFDYMVDLGCIVRGSEKYPVTGMHRDNEADGIDTEHMYGVLLYLNSDFDGGEICYPELDVVYKPKPGVLLIHHASNLHGVNPVNSGVRYSMIAFAVGLNSKINF